MKYDLNGVFPTEKISLYNCDNMELMKQTPDIYYDLAILDPPYGISINANMGLKKGKKKKHKEVEWDDEIPSGEYWSELFRISKNQIVWGGNYFPHIWINGCKHFIFWDKLVPDGMSFSSGELAWTSFNMADKKMVLRNITSDKIHPTQKPSDLYKWILSRYAEKNDKIIDTHGGSFSLALACHDLGFTVDICEINNEYFNAGVERVKKHVSQLSLFEPEELTQKNETLFD